MGKFSAAAFLAKQEEGFHRAFAFDFDFSWFGKFEFIPQQIAESSGNLNLSSSPCDSIRLCDVYGVPPHVVNEFLSSDDTRYDGAAMNSHWISKSS